MSSAVMGDGSGTAKDGTTTLPSPPTAIDGTTRAKCSPVVGTGIATNTIMITNNYSKNGLTPTSSTTTTTSNSSKITILAHDDHDDEDVARPLRHRPMVVDQINICINNHFSGDAAAALMTTTASATAKLPDLIKIQKKRTQWPEMKKTAEDFAPKLGYEAEVKQEIDMELDVEEQVARFAVKKKDPQAFEELEKTKTEQQAPVIPHKFSIGEEVLVPRKTFDASCFYLGILTVLRDDQALVQFEDGTNCWTSVADIRHILRQPNTIYCVVCKTRELQSERSATIECVKCARAYHKECLRRELDALASSADAATEKINTTIDCLRCFKRLVGIDQAQEEDVAMTVHGKQSQDARRGNKSNSSNTGNNSTTSLIGHQQVEIGAPSMDWFTKERRGDAMATSTVSFASSSGNGVDSRNGEEIDLPEEDEDGEGDTAKDDEYCEYANGRRLRKRQQKQNYKDIQRKSGCGGATFSSALCQSSSSWSCSSSASSTASSVAWCASSFGGNSPSALNMFTLEELRWAFLPKSHKFKRRGQKKGAAAVIEKKIAQQLPVKVPYERQRRTSRDASSAAEYTQNEGASGRRRGEDLKLLDVIGGRDTTFETKSRLARGEKFVVRGKRQDQRGNVQYLVEWESGKA